MCAPETGPRIAISTNSMAAVAAVLPSKAIASLPPERFAAITPEPMTQANRKNAPRPSAASRRASGARSGIGRSDASRGSCSFAGADLAQMCLQGQLVDAFLRQLDQQRDPVAQIAQRLLERLSLAVAFDRGGVFDAPVRGDRMPRPDRAAFAGGVVADGDDEVDRRGIPSCKLVPALRAQTLHREAVAAQHIERHRMRRAFGLAARRESAKAAFAQMVEQGLGEERARRVPGTQEQDVARLAHAGAQHLADRSPL